ncbi:MAG: (R)-hydratase, partial [Azovibrio sp.]
GTIYMAHNLKFKAPVRAGDTVTATVTIKEVILEKKRAVIETVCTVNGKVVIDGEATVMCTSRAA